MVLLIIKYGETLPVGSFDTNLLFLLRVKLILIASVAALF
jgi:hypothetical protein